MKEFFKKFFAFPLVRLMLILVSIAALLWGTFALARPTDPTSINWLTLAVIFAAVALVERFAAGLKLAQIGFARAHMRRDALLGFALGAVLFTLVVLEMAALGSYRIDEVHVTPALALSLAVLVPAAIYEEVLFRGAIFRLFEEWGGTWIGLAVSAAFFGLVHVLNPGATWLSTTAIAVEAGILLGAAYVVTKNLWFPIGIHFAWNFFEGPVFGTQVSGRTFFTDAVTAHVSGPTLLTGGSFGPEASLPAMLTCTAAAVALLVYAVRTRAIVPPKWFKPIADPAAPR